jgi:hypothetical protein
VIVKKNGVEIASYDGSRTAGDQVIQDGGSAILITNGVITGVIATAGNEGDVYQVDVLCPDGTRSSVGATLGEFPFPNARLVYFYSVLVPRTPPSDGNFWQAQQRISVDTPPALVRVPDGRIGAENGLAGGGRGVIQVGFAEIEGIGLAGRLRIDRASYYLGVVGNSTTSVSGEVSTITY